MGTAVKSKAWGNTEAGNAGPEGGQSTMPGFTHYSGPPSIDGSSISRTLISSPWPSLKDYHHVLTTGRVARVETTGKKLPKLHSFSSSHDLEHVAGSGHRAAPVLETLRVLAFSWDNVPVSRKAAYFISATKSALDLWDDEESAEVFTRPGGRIRIFCQILLRTYLDLGQMLPCPSHSTWPRFDVAHAATSMSLLPSYNCRCKHRTSYRGESTTYESCKADLDLNA